MSTKDMLGEQKPSHYDKPGYGRDSDVWKEKWPQTGPERAALSSEAVASTTDYAKFRGRCKEVAEQAIAEDPTLRLIRGWYHCPVWGKQAHWWCVKPNGEIVDPTVAQFPTKGAGAEYEEFDGYFDCEYCGKEVAEDEGYKVEHHFYCSYACYGHDVGF